MAQKALERHRLEMGKDTLKSRGLLRTPVLPPDKKSGM
jgi:hypothetical protein